MAEGDGCPFCRPRPDIDQYKWLVADLSVSTLYLDRDQRYSGRCLLTFNPRHEARWEQLDESESASFFADLRKAAIAVIGAVGPDHMNYASLGNVIPHLHWHLIPRFQSDPRWTKPVWTTHRGEAEPLYVDDREYEELASRIRGCLEVR